MGRLLCLVLGAVLFALGFWRFRSRHRELRRLLDGRRSRYCPSPLPETCWRRTTRHC